MDEGVYEGVVGLAWRFVPLGLVRRVGYSQLWRYEKKRVVFVEYLAGGLFGGLTDCCAIYQDATACWRT